MEDIFDILSEVTGITKYSGSEVITPKDIVADMVDLLPTEVFVPEARFLDPAVKSGRFLAEIYRRLMDSDAMTKEFPNEQDRQKHILGNQLYGLATSPVAATITRKALYDDPTIAGNIVYVDRYLVKMAEKTTDFKKLVQGEFGENMKFDVVIGNPPYQNDKDKKLYCKFMMKAYYLSERFVSLIVKNKWMTSVDKDGALGFNDVRNTLLVNKHCFAIVDYPMIGDIFKTVGTSVCYYLCDKGRTGNCTYKKYEHGKITEEYSADFSKTGMVLKSKIITDIANKTLSKKNFSELSIFNKPCGLETSEVPAEASLEYGEGHEIAYVSSNGVYYAGLGSFDNIYHANINQYNVVAGEKVHAWERIPENVVTSINIIKPKATCSGTWTQLFSSDSREEAHNFTKYLYTKFCRVTIKAGYSAYGRFVNEYMRFCPLQDFTSNSDIDWSQSVADIDKQLYKKYGLTQDEIEYIENTIKPME